MFAIAHVNMNNLLRYFVIALALVVGVVVLSVMCADGLCSACGHVFVNGEDRLSPLARLARRLSGTAASVMSRGLQSFALASRELYAALPSFVPTPPLVVVAPLRI